MANVFDDVLPPQSGVQGQVQNNQANMPQQGANQTQPNATPQGTQQSATVAPSSGPNLFDDVLPPKQNNNTQQSAEITRDSEYRHRLANINQDGNSIGQSTMDFVDSFNKTMASIPNGLMQLAGLGDVKATGGISASEQQARNEQLAAAAYQRSPIAATAGNVLGIGGGAINSLAAMGGLGTAAGAIATKAAPQAFNALQEAAGTLLPKVLGASANGAAYMGSQYVDPGDSRLQNALSGAAIGAASVPASALAEWGLDKAGKFAGYLNKAANPEGAALSNTVGMLKNVKDDLHPNGVTGQDIQNAVDASAGNNLSLGEITREPAITSMESKLGTGTPQDVAAVTAHLNNLNNNLGPQITNTINSIVPEGSPSVVSDKLAAAYEDLKNYTVPQDNMKQLMGNSTLSTYLNDLGNNPIMPQSMQNLPINNVAKLANINVDLNKALYKNTSLLTKDAGRVLTPTERTALIEAKAQLQGTLNQVVPDNGYANTMDLAQRNIQRNGMLENIDNIKGGAGSVDLNGQMTPPLKQVANALWGTQPQVNNFLAMVKASGGDVDVAKNLIYTVNHVVDSPVNTILKGTRVGAETTAQKVQSEGIIKEAIGELTTNDYKRSALQLFLGGGDNHATLIKALDTPTLGAKIVNLNAALKSIPGVTPTIDAATQSGIPSKMVMQSHDVKAAEKSVSNAIGHL